MKQTGHSTKWRKLHMHYSPKECKPFSKDVITPGESILKAQLCKLSITSHWKKLVQQTLFSLVN